MSASTRRTPVTILDAMSDPRLFGPWFANAQTWMAWRTFLAAVFALQLAGEGLDTYRRHTGRQNAPATAAKEAWLIVGRRGGKSRIAALIATYLACFLGLERFLAKGERGTIMVIAADRRQARVIFRYIEALFDGVEMLAALIESRTKEEINLTNGISIEVQTASFRSVRGYTVLAALLDEVAFWRSDESANPDAEIINALRPGMATIPDAILVAMSSPYARRGALWDAYRRHFGKDDDPVLVWQADTRSMNPAVPESVIREAYEADEPSAAAEFGALFRKDIEAYVSREAVDAVVIKGRRELPPLSSLSYSAFVDPSGGASDSMTMAIAHQERGEVLVVDALRERRPPFSPEDVVKEFAETLKAYRVSSVRGDRYAGEWPRERFREHAIEYQVGEKPKSDLYRDLLPIINSKRIELLDEPRLITQLCNLERRTARGGKDSIDHAPNPNAHDDLANVVAGVASIATVGGYDIEVLAG